MTDIQFVDVSKTTRGRNPEDPFISVKPGSPVFFSASMEDRLGIEADDEFCYAHHEGGVWVGTTTRETKIPSDQIRTKWIPCKTASVTPAHRLIDDMGLDGEKRTLLWATGETFEYKGVTLHEVETR